jgi:hypothetical protein
MRKILVVMSEHEAGEAVVIECEGDLRAFLDAGVTVPCGTPALCRSLFIGPQPLSPSSMARRSGLRFAAKVMRQNQNLGWKGLNVKPSPP